jgi:transposase-like protein
MKCIYCNYPTYKLKNGYYKCKSCKSKFSPKKNERQRAIKRCFYKDFTINRCALYLGLNYITVKNYYQKIREEIAILQEKDFANKQKILEYDEYIYIPKTKSLNKSAIFEGFNFLTYNYDNKIYNILLPSLSRYKPIMLEDGLDEVYYKELEKFLQSNHISNRANNNLIKQFWIYLEDFMLKFNGINSDNFFYYLKEAECKFNNLSSK